MGGDAGVAVKPCADTGRVGGWGWGWGWGWGRGGGRGRGLGGGRAGTGEGLRIRGRKRKFYSVTKNAQYFSIYVIEFAYLTMV